jgi:hypothetical protein
MSESETFSQLEIAHVLFTDIVAYSKKPIDPQSELLGQLNRVVRGNLVFLVNEIRPIRNFGAEKTCLALSPLRVMGAVVALPIIGRSAWSLQ